MRRGPRKKEDEKEEKGRRGEQRREGKGGGKIREEGEKEWCVISVKAARRKGMAV